MHPRILHLSATNDYLVETGNGFLLVDTGYEEDWPLFERQLRAVGVSLAQISHLFLTHHHDDHCGLLGKITQANPQIRVVMSGQAKDLLLAGENDRTHGGGMINRQIQRLWIFKQGYLSIKLGRWVDKNNHLEFPVYRARAQDILISRDTRLKEIGIDLDAEILTTPGHSVDSISLLLDCGACFVGDAAANFLQMAGTHYCVIFVTDLDEYYKSWEKLLAWPVRTIYPAHGKPFPAEKLAENLHKNTSAGMVRV